MKIHISLFIIMKREILNGKFKKKKWFLLCSLSIFNENKMLFCPSWSCTIICIIWFTALCKELIKLTWVFSRSFSKPCASFSMLDARWNLFYLLRSFLKIKEKVQHTIKLSPLKVNVRLKSKRKVSLQLLLWKKIPCALSCKFSCHNLYLWL